MNKDIFSRRIIVALVKDNPGVLAAIVGVIRRRGINIASLAVGHSEKNKFSRMTFVVEGQEKPLANISSQLNKLIDLFEGTLDFHLLLTHNSMAQQLYQKLIKCKLLHS